MSLRHGCFRSGAVIATLAFALAATSPARAGFVVLDTPINGAVPSGSLLATIEDAGLNTVRLTMDATGLTGATQYVPVWLFNLSPSWDFSANPLSFSYVSGVQALTTGAGPDAFNGGNSVKGGLFDVLFTFQNSNSGTPPLTRLTAGATSIYDITAVGLTASSFDAVSAAGGGGPGGYFSVADVRGIPPSGGSGSIGASSSFRVVPEPSSMALSAIFVASVAGRFGLRAARKRRAS